MSYFEKQRKKQSLVIVVGPFSSGTKLCSLLCGLPDNVYSTGGSEHSETNLFWDTLDPNDLDFHDKEYLVTHRSFPHFGGLLKFYDLKAVIEAVSQKYNVFLVVCTRDKTINALSASKTHGVSFDKAFEYIEKAYDTIFGAIADTKIDYFVHSYETAMNLKDLYVSGLYRFLKYNSTDLPSNKIYHDANKKYLFNENTDLLRLIRENDGHDIYSRFLLYSLVRHISAELVVEIGTLRGGAAAWIAQAIKENGGGKLLCIDSFEEGYGSTGKNNYEMAKSRLKPYDGIEFIKSRSEKALPEIPDDSVDFVHVDGSHTAEMARFDTKQALRIVKRGGIVAVHDVSSHTEVYDSTFDLASDNWSIILPGAEGYIIIQNGEPSFNVNMVEARTPITYIESYDPYEKVNA